MTRILTVDNQVYDLDFIPEEIEDIRYCVFKTTVIQRKQIIYLFHWYS